MIDASRRATPGVAAGAAVTSLLGGYLIVQRSFDQGAGAVPVTYDGISLSTASTRLRPIAHERPELPGPVTPERFGGRGFLTGRADAD